MITALLLSLLGSPPASQEVVDLPVDDTPVCTRFDEMFRVSSDRTTVSSIGFDRSGTVRIGDETPGSGFRVVAVTADGTQFE